MQRTAKFTVVCVAIGIGLFGFGCSEKKASETDDSKLRQAYKSKKFDINDVPPAQRAMVQGLMAHQKPAEATPTPAPKK